MKKIFSFLLLFTLSLAVKAQDNYKDNYKNYCNGRFEFCVTYPANLATPQPESANGDGCKMLAKQGKAKITTWGNLAMTFVVEGNADFDKVEELKNDFEAAQKAKKVTYKVLKKDWFVVSGTDENGLIFYRKTIHKGLIVITVLIEYPSTEKAIWDKECGKIAGSLKFE